MPFCEPCARHWTPSSMKEDGSCPACGRMLEASVLAREATAVLERRGDDERGQPARPIPKAPWHFKVLLASLVFYLGFRAFQGLEWLASRL